MPGAGGLRFWSGLLGHNPSIQFDSAKFAWLGSASSFASDAYRLIARPAAPVKARSAAMRWSAPSTGSAATSPDTLDYMKKLLTNKAGE